MKRNIISLTILFIIFSTFLYCGCTCDQRAIQQNAPSPLFTQSADVARSLDIPEIKAALEVWKTSRAIERVQIDDKQELFVFDVGLLTVDDVARYKAALAARGWRLTGTRRQTLKKWPAPEETVFEKDGSRMYFWAGGSFGWGLVGITMKK